MLISLKRGGHFESDFTKNLYSFKFEFQTPQKPKTS